MRAVSQSRRVCAFAFILSAQYLFLPLAQFGHPLKLFLGSGPQIPEIVQHMCFLENDRLDALDGCKILLWGVGTIRRPGKHHSGETTLNFVLSV